MRVSADIFTGEALFLFPFSPVFRLLFIVYGIPEAERSPCL